MLFVMLMKFWRCSRKANMTECGSPEAWCQTLTRVMKKDNFPTDNIAIHCPCSLAILGLASLNVSFRAKFQQVRVLQCNGEAWSVCWVWIEEHSLALLRLWHTSRQDLCCSAGVELEMCPWPRTDRLIVKCSCENFIYPCHEWNKCTFTSLKSDPARTRTQRRTHWQRLEAEDWGWWNNKRVAQQAEAASWAGCWQCRKPGLGPCWTWRWSSMGRRPWLWGGISERLHRHRPTIAVYGTLELNGCSENKLCSKALLK